jgi:hypothetical protein
MMFNSRLILVGIVSFYSLAGFAASPTKHMHCRNTETRSVFNMKLAATEYDDYSAGKAKYLMNSKNLLKILAGQGRNSFNIEDIGDYKWNENGFHFKAEDRRNTFSVTQTKDGVLLRYLSTQGGDGTASLFLFNPGECWIDEQPLK